MLRVYQESSKFWVSLGLFFMVSIRDFGELHFPFWAKGEFGIAGVAVIFVPVHMRQSRKTWYTKPDKYVCCQIYVTVPVWLVKAEIFHHF